MQGRSSLQLAELNPTGLNISREEKITIHHLWFSNYAKLQPHKRHGRAVSISSYLMHVLPSSARDSPDRLVAGVFVRP